jgi:hypothetical protein
VVSGRSHRRLGDKVYNSESGSSFIRFLAEKFRHEDEDGEYGLLGVGCQVIYAGVVEEI